MKKLHCLSLLLPALTVAVLFGACGRSPAPGGATSREAAAPTEPSPAEVPRGQALLDRAWEQLNEGKLMQAVTLTDFAVTRQPDDPFALTAAALVQHYWGIALRQEKENNKAQSRLEAAADYITKRMKMPDPTATDYQVAIEIMESIGSKSAMVHFAEQACKAYPDEFWLREYHAHALGESGRYSEALARIIELEKEQPDKVWVVSRKAYLLRALGWYDRAVETYEHAIALSGDQQNEELESEYNAALWMISDKMEETKFWRHFEQGMRHTKVGRTDRAAAEDALALEVLEAMQKQGVEMQSNYTDFYIGKCHEGIANGMALMGQFEKAYEHAKLAVRFLRAYNGDRYPIAYAMNMAAQKANDFANSLDPADPRAMELREEAAQLGKDAVEFCNTYQVGHVRRHAMATLVSVLHELGREDDPLFTQMREEMLPRTLPDGAQSDCSMVQAAMAEGRIAYQNKDYARAAQLYEWTKQRKGSDSVITSLRERFGQSTALVHCYAELGEPKKVVEAAEQMLEAADQLRLRLNDDVMKRRLVGLNLHSAVAIAAQAYLDMDQARFAFQLSERYKGRALAELVRGKALLPLPSTPAAAPAPAVVAGAPAEAAVDDPIANLGSTLRDLKIEQTAITRLEQDTRVAEKTVASLGTDLAFKAPELMPMTKYFTLVSYVFGNKTGMALVLKEDGVTGVPLPELTNARLTELLFKLREAYDTRGAAPRDLAIESTHGEAGAPPDAAEVSEALYDLLIGPVLPHVDKPLLYLCTDGVLNYLPFDLLQKDGRYLVEDYAIAYTPSTSFLKGLLDKPRPERNTILALGNPNLKNPAFRLVNAEAEALEVRQLFSAGNAFVQDNATEAMVYAYAAEADILHFACHGETNEDNPMLTALRLAPDAEHDGYLHAGEVFDLQLKPSLVVLSACNSGVGETSTGNELMGLTRSFFYAGAQSIVASLWFVDDRSTAELMQAFYQNLATMDTATALQMAKLQIKEKYPHPIHWAPFALQGDYR